ncbi:MAG: glycoside hydrolase family 15 protein [Planctomycetaceae bacterium]
MSHLPADLAQAPLETADDVRRIMRFLDLQGTFYFPTLPNGLFSAAAATHDDFQHTGYDSIWVRDNVHIAYAQMVLGNELAAVRTVTALLAFQSRQRAAVDALLDGRTDPADPMRRPHIRFDGKTLDTLPEKWAHAQNDALGYLIWLASQLIQRGSLVPDADQLRTLADLVHVLRRVEYWQDEDSGHWEETRKIEASSIGAVVAGLHEFQVVCEDDRWGEILRGLSRPITSELLEELVTRGELALQEILPWECRQPDPLQNRQYDAALLFLIDPLNIVDDDTANEIVAGVRTHLMGEHGIRRYLGDSYWCADYRTLLSAETRTTDFSDDTSSRDALLKPGEEAQWCIFDPILSVIFGERFQMGGAPADIEQQRLHLRRSLSQLTPPDSPFGPYRCPESYFLERGRFTPNDITPLLWTQANLLRALAMMEQSLMEDEPA